MWYSYVTFSLVRKNKQLFLGQLVKFCTVICKSESLTFKKKLKKINAN